MAFGKKQPQSYGVPVRSAAPAPLPVPEQQPLPAHAFAAAPAPWTPAPPPPAGFYAPAAAPQLPMAAQFTAAPVAPANPYAQQTWSPVGSGYPPLPPHAPYTGRSSTTRKPFKIAGAVIGVLILGSAAYQGIKAQSALKAPASIGSLQKSTDPALQATADQITKEMRKENSGHGATLAYYTGADGEVEVMLIAVRGRTQEDREIRDALESGLPIEQGTRQQFGDISCYAAETAAVCMWSGSDISGMVMTVRSGDMAAAAGIAAEARSSLH